MQKQIEFQSVKGWGGRRRGAGRPNKSGLVSHAKRAGVDFKKPLHITLRLKEKMPRLRTREFHRQFKVATVRTREFGLFLNHYSLQSNHIHLIAEARDNEALTLGMKSLAGRLGKFIRRACGDRGAVWAGRFHLHVLKTPTEVKRALEYVLLNTAKHAKLIEHLDEFSSGDTFRDWKKLLGARRISGLIWEQLASFAKTPKSDTVNSAGLSLPRSWLLNRGWMRACSESN